MFCSAVSSFQDILAESSTAMAEEYVKYLDKVELLQPLQDPGLVRYLYCKLRKTCWDEPFRRIDEVDTVR